MNQNQIIVKVDKNYGRYVTYPVCELSKQFCQLAKTKTITHEMEMIIQKMGFAIVDSRDSLRI